MSETRLALTPAPERPELDALLAKARAITTRRETIIIDEDDAREALGLLAESSDALRTCLAEIERQRAELAGLPYVSPAVVRVLAERRRQIEVEGYTPAHDDAHDKGELAGAAAAYAAYRSQVAAEIIMGDEIIATLWPWPGDGSYKPKGRHRDLERACTLLIAEIERLDRLAERRAASEA